MAIEPTRVFALLLPGEMRRLTRTGVMINRLEYWNDCLAPWVGRGLKVMVHYDPRDITIAYVETPLHEVVLCHATRTSTPRISLAEWQARHRHELSLVRLPENLAIVDASRKRRHQLVAEAKASRKVNRRKATEAAGDKYRAQHVEEYSPQPAMIAVADDYVPKVLEVDRD